MKDKKAFLWATIGGLVVAILLPFLSMAVQTYVLPSGTTGQRTEMLTNAPNRDEAMRSGFSGAAAPTTPTPLAGQLWMDTTNDVLNVRNAAATAWSKLLRSGSVVSADITDGTLVDADIAATGITTRSKLPSAVAYEDEANVLTADQRIHKSIPSIHLRPSADSELLGIIMRTTADAVSGHFLYRPNDSTFYFTDAAGAVKFGLNIATGAMTTGIVPLARLSAANANAGYPQSGTGGETLRTVRGRVNAAGTVNLGTGWGVSTPSTGVYNITITTPFAASPVFVGTINGLGFISFESATSNSVTFRTYNSAGTPTDILFDFIAIGPS